MDGKLQVIAGILALFFLGVAIAKSMVQRARRREEEARRIAASKESQEVSLHNPFAAEGDSATQREDGGRTEEAAAMPDSRQTTASDAGIPDRAEAQAESTYKWE